MSEPGSAPLNVLFLCTGNSARSIMAEAMMNHPSIGRDKFHAFSAGSHPRGQVHPLALEVLAAHEISTTGLRSKGWNEFATPGAPAMHYVITVCDAAAAETCPIFPGHPATEHWSLRDPAAMTGSDDRRRQAFTETMDVLRGRIEAFVAASLSHRP